MRIAQKAERETHFESVFPKGKSTEIKAAGEGYNSTFAGIFTLLHPGTDALRGRVRMRLSVSFPNSTLALAETSGLYYPSQQILPV